MEEYLLVLKFIGLLVLVALLAYAAIRFGLRRLQPAAGRGYIRILQKMPLDMKGDRLLILIRMGERILLLGSAPGGISVLHQFPAGELAPLSEHPEPAEPGGLFAGLLDRYRRGTGSEGEGGGS